MKLMYFNDFRLGVIKTWNSKWFEDKSYAKWLHEDIRIKRAVKDYLMNANIASVEVERAANIEHALDECEDGWCRVRARRLRGWIQERAVFGVQQRALCNANRPAGTGRG